MEPAYWHGRWETNQIGFHEGKPNDLLIAHVDVLGLTPKSRVLVPLAGKALDVRFLAERAGTVVGVELVRAACDAFFTESGLTPTVDEHAGFARLRHGNVELWCGDFFALPTPPPAEQFDAVYDRAALVAIDPNDRVRYVEVLRRSLRPGGRILLVSFDYDQAKLPGPPWSVDVATTRALFGDRGFTVEVLASREVDRNPKFVEAGIERLVEHALLLTRT